MTSASVLPVPSDDLDVWESQIALRVEQDETVPETDRLAIVRARRRQALFRERVSEIERRCRITRVENSAHLVASHCKPWRDATNDKRLDRENGLLPTPTIDHLFDRGFIGFENDGRLIVSPVAHKPSLERMGIDVNAEINVGPLSSGQKKFLELHREAVLLKSAIGRDLRVPQRSIFRC